MGSSRWARHEAQWRKSTGWALPVKQQPSFADNNGQRADIQML